MAKTVPDSAALLAAQALDAEYEAASDNEPLRLELLASGRALARYLCVSGWVTACGLEGCSECNSFEPEPRQHDSEPVPWEDLD